MQIDQIWPKFFPVISKILVSVGPYQWAEHHVPGRCLRWTISAIGMRFLFRFLNFFHSYLIENIYWYCACINLVKTNKLLVGLENYMARLKAIYMLVGVVSKTFCPITQSMKFAYFDFNFHSFVMCLSNPSFFSWLKCIPIVLWI